MHGLLRWWKNLRFRRKTVVELPALQRDGMGASSVDEREAFDIACFMRCGCNACRGRGERRYRAAREGVRSILRSEYPKVYRELWEMTLQ